MPSFDEFAKAIQFGSGLLGGFAASVNQERQKNEQEQLALLKLLTQDEEGRLQVLNKDEVVGGGGGLFGGRRRVAKGSGLPVFQLGGQFVTVNPSKGIDLSGLAGSGQQASPLAQPTPTQEPLQYTPSFAPATQEPTSTAPATPTPATPAPTPGTMALSAVTPDIRSQVLAAAREASQATGVPVPVILAYGDKESGFDPNATSSSGARGIMQLMPDTAKRFGVTNITDIRQNIMGGARLIAEGMKQHGQDWERIYKKVYNPSDSKAGITWERIKSVLPQYQNLPALQPKLQQKQNIVGEQGQPVTAPQQVTDLGPTLTDIGTGAQAPVQPAPEETQAPTGMEVAGPGAPPPRDFPQPETAESHGQAQVIPLAQTLFPGRKPLVLTRREADQLGKALKDEKDKWQARADRVPQEVERLLKQEHREQAVDMLHNVRTPGQLDYALRYLNRLPQGSPIDEARAMLTGKAAAGANIDADVAQARTKLAYLGYDAKLIEDTFESIPGYTPPKERRTEERQTARQKEIERERIEAEQRKEATQVRVAEEKATAAEKRRGDAFQDVHSAMTGNASPNKLGGLDPYEYSLKRMNEAGIHDEKSWPQVLQDEHALRKPIADAARRLRVDPTTYAVQSVRSEREAVDKGLVPITAKDAQEVRAISVTINALENAEERLVKMWAPGGTLQNVRDAGGWGANLQRRLGGAFAAASAEKAQTDKDIQALRGFLRDMAIKIDRGAFGDRGKPLKDFVERAEQQLPNLGSLTSPPDLRETAYQKWGYLLDTLEKMRQTLVEDGTEPPGPSTHTQRLMNKEAQVAPPAPPQSKADSYRKKALQGAGAQ